MRQPYLHFLGGGRFAYLIRLNPETFGEDGWEIGEDQEVMVEDRSEADRVIAGRPKTPMTRRPEKPLRKNKDGSLRKQPPQSKAQKARMERLAIEQTKLPAVKLLKVRRPVWRSFVRLNKREQASLGAWLLSQRQHVKRLPWQHARVPDFKFVRYGDQTTRGKLRVEMVWRHRLGEERCLLSVDYLLEELGEMAKGGK